ncbi:uncharacterized protein LOC131614478 [Vicia villosa]|uniref:uncharacterized protein LOC131614478 n=1 Tax=Vicia villosa TaxID=3911 RepID=UPI00273C7BCB|nr:uncharacterized protein LOC131614478 [Vicia villosa]
MNDKKGQFRGKPYDNKKKAGFGGKPSGGGSSAPIMCFKCGVEGHRAINCPKVEVTCFKCGKSGHKANECRGGSKAALNVGSGYPKCIKEFVVKNDGWKPPDVGDVALNWVATSFVFFIAL